MMDLHEDDFDFIANLINENHLARIALLNSDDINEVRLFASPNNKTNCLTFSELRRDLIYFTITLNAFTICRTSNDFFCIARRPFDTIET